MPAHLSSSPHPPRPPPSLFLSLWTLDQSTTRLIKEAYQTCGGRRELSFLHGAGASPQAVRVSLAIRRTEQALEMNMHVSLEALLAAQPGEEVRSSFRAKLFSWTFSFLESTRQAPVKLEVCMCRVSSWPPLISWGMAPIKQERRRPILNVTQSGRKESAILLAKLNRILFLRPSLSLGRQFDPPG